MQFRLLPSPLFTLVGSPHYWHKSPSTPGPQHQFGIPKLLSHFCKASAGDRRLMGSGSPRVTFCGVPVNTGLRPSCLHLMNGDLHEPALGLGLDLAQPHCAQPLPQHALCMSTSCPGWSLSWLTSPALHCPQRAAPWPLRDRAVERGRRMGVPCDQRRLGKNPSLLPRSRFPTNLVLEYASTSLC